MSKHTDFRPCKTLNEFRDFRQRSGTVVFILHERFKRSDNSGAYDGSGLRRFSAILG